jgi:hypothetical protein
VSSGSSEAPAAPGAAPRVDAPAWVQKNLVGWPPLTVKVAVDLVRKYGIPAEHDGHCLTWYANPPWRETTLYREEVQHNFPQPHKDILQQSVNYRVPPEKVGDLAAYNGSIVVDRTRGELAAHCDTEAANILALNIANDIVRGERSVEQALGYHAQVVRGVAIGEPESYPLKLRFPVDPSSRQSADPAEEAPLLYHLQH